ncbi:hypothetical protein [Microbulbifer donghaiensis]|nr:hypothetical protein [Microbulbifer donghaiensis]
MIDSNQLLGKLRPIPAAVVVGLLVPLATLKFAQWRAAAEPE